MAFATRVQGWAIIGISLVGVVAGHLVDYLIAFPLASHRHHLLESTGHFYMKPASYFTAGIGLVCAASLLGIGYKSLRTSGERSLQRWPVTRKLFVCQSLAFVAVEFVERMASRSPIDGAALRIIFLGIGCQLLIAIIAGIVARSLIDAGQSLAAKLSGRVPDQGEGPVIAIQRIARDPSGLAELRSGLVRGPPSSSALSGGTP
ncbi:MAG: hypothetical protein LC723_02280 [Actinobacteria bacterium]|nr:hypothetical protein [Actinomycetota bacterium]